MATITQIKQIAVVGLVIIVAFMSGCLESEVIAVDHYDEYGLHYVGDVTKKPSGGAYYNLTIDGELDGYPFMGTAVGPESNVTMTCEVQSLLPNVPNFTGTMYRDISSIDNERYDLITQKVVTELDYTNETEMMHYTGTLTQERGNEPYYDMRIKTVDSDVMKMYVVNGTMVGYETNVTIVMDIDTMLGPGSLFGRKDLNAPEDEWLENRTSGILASDDLGTPGFGSMFAITGLLVSIYLLRRRALP